MKLCIYEKDYTLANGKKATDITNKSTQVKIDLNNPEPLDFTDNDYKTYKNAKAFTSDETGKPMISHLKSGATIITDKTGIQLYIKDSNKQERVFVYNQVISNKDSAKNTTQNILNKLKSLSVDNTIDILENSSSGFTEVFTESYAYLNLFKDKDFTIK